MFERSDLYLNHQCIFDCHARELGVLTGEQDIDEAKMLEMVNQVPDEDVKKLMEQSVKECFKAKDEILEKAKGQNMKCHPLAMMMTECIMHAIFSECETLPNHWKGCKWMTLILACEIGGILTCVTIVSAEICTQVKNGAKPCA